MLVQTNYNFPTNSVRKWVRAKKLFKKIGSLNTVVKINGFRH